MPGAVDAVGIATRHEHAVGTMRDAVDQGIKWVWLRRAFGGDSLCDGATA